MDKFKLVQKAYRVDYSRIEEGYLASETVCYADSLNQARSKLFNEIRYDGWLLYISQNEVTYLNIPVIRSKNNDKFEFEGEILSLNAIERLLKRREREELLNALLADPIHRFCYIRKNGYYYRPKSTGYSEYRTNAGVYTIEKGVYEAMSCDDLTIIPIDIDEHNEMLINEINELKSKLI